MNTYLPRHILLIIFDLYGVTTFLYPKLYILPNPSVLFMIVVDFYVLFSFCFCNLMFVLYLKCSFLTPSFSDSRCLFGMFFLVWKTFSGSFIPNFQILTRYLFALRSIPPPCLFCCTSIDECGWQIQIVTPNSCHNYYLCIFLRSFCSLYVRFISAHQLHICSSVWQRPVFHRNTGRFLRSHRPACPEQRQSRSAKSATVFSSSLWDRAAELPSGSP